MMIKTVPSSRHVHRGRGRGESAHSPRRIKAAENQRTALEFRKIGMTYAQIASKLGMRSRQTAWNAVHSAFRRTRQAEAKRTAIERDLELWRLDALMVAIYPDACRGDLAACSMALRIMEMRARLLGLDSPVTSANRFS